MTAQDQLSIGLLPTKIILSKTTVSILILLLVSGVVFSLCLQTNGEQYYWQLPSSFQWDIKWPRLLAATFAGLALVLRGFITRIIYNPLASPDILGVSSGATAALVLFSLLLGTAIQTSFWGVALIREPDCIRNIVISR